MKNKTIRPSDLNRLLRYLKKYKLTAIAALFFGVVSGVGTVLSTYLIGTGIDTLVGAGEVNFDILTRILLWLGTAYLITLLSQWLVRVLANQVSFKVVRDLRMDTFKKLNQLPLSFFDQTVHGNVVSRFTNDLESLSEALVLILSNLFTGIIIILSALGFMLYLSPVLTLVVLSVTPLFFLVGWLVAKHSQKYFSQQQNVLGNLSGYASEMITGQKVVKAFNYEEKMEETFQEMNLELYNWGQKAQFASSITNPASRFIDHVAYLMIGVIGGLLVINNVGAVTIGTISSFVIYSSQFSKPFIEISGIMTQVQTAIAGLNRIYKIIDTPNEVPDTKEAVVMENPQGKVEFKNVSFSYDPNIDLIKNLSISVEAGETVAIVGQTGAGKSTLINLLMRFYELDEGTIEIDGKDSTRYTRDSLRKSFGMVLQDTWLFDGSVKDNIRYGKPEASDEEIITAAKSAYAHSFIERLPNGYDTKLGNKGISLSTGQQQLLTIARVMLADPPMLILDEATSSVDTLTEVRIQTAFLKMMEGRTSFVIAHRLSTIREADVILVMDQGTVVEVGNHDTLMQKKGYYHRLHESQFK
ncbi:sugar ABC transporter ATP-binding protein [Marinilactibacillus sp. 15R]|uniref:ATP-binding cassette, subfamily B n=1 Tax=Marinilactibacillus piezotolerans TaxID=258723 RepID=A0A1I4AAT8_9LACT|nr:MULTISPECIES: ABC transporter ATP-binding protein [Marinilactibacillus]API88845.1 sugar ABC transporter ATP-binding protein [Marinilactibacillus sp. 15R]SFK53071.1 ATP-binding cassette, subfamily B [Marinilactibacillus piezotolerans]